MLVVATVGLTFLAACGADRQADVASRQSSADVGGLRDVTAQAGLDFAHVNGQTGHFRFLETVGSGGALFDYDGDGDLDVYLVQGRLIDETDRPETSSELGDRLWQNDTTSVETRPSLRFVDVSDRAGLGSRGYGMGAAVSDVDRDGWLDLYVSQWGENKLYRNRGDGGFADVSVVSRTNDRRWSTGAAFLDYDLDGWSDLFVVNYVEYNEFTERPCFTAGGRRSYCNPQSFEASSDALYRNRGDGSFDDVTTEVGMTAGLPAAGLGLVVGDLDGNGFDDVFVTNDLDRNNLWMNRGGGHLSDEALLAGTALNRKGQAESSMGVDAADFDRDGDEDLIVTHLTRETHTLYVNGGNGIFEDRTREHGLEISTWEATGWGVGWLDLDLDGWLDLLVVNGKVRADDDDDVRDASPLAQRNQVFVQRDGGRFEDASARAGDVAADRSTSRGAAFGDLDNDGRTDVIVTANGGRAQLLWSEASEPASFVGVIVRRDGSSSEGWSASLEVGAEVLTRRSRRASSFLTSNDPRLRLAALNGARRLRLRVASRRDVVLEQAPVGRYLIFAPGEGQP